MTDREKWQAIYLLVPRSWLPLMNQARGDTSRAVWVRDLIRDALKVKETWPEMTKYHALTGSLSLCFSCLNIENDKCPGFKSPSGKVFNAKEWHDIGCMFGGITIQDCSHYSPDKSKLPKFALERLLEMKEEW